MMNTKISVLATEIPSLMHLHLTVFFYRKDLTDYFLIQLKCFLIEEVMKALRFKFS